MLIVFNCGEMCFSCGYFQCLKNTLKYKLVGNLRMFSLLTKARERRNYVNFINFWLKNLPLALFIEDVYKGTDGIPVNFLLCFIYCYFHYYHDISYNLFIPSLSYAFPPMSQKHFLFFLLPISKELWKILI